MHLRVEVITSSSRNRRLASGQAAAGQSDGESEAFEHTGDQVRASCLLRELDPVEDSFDYSYRQLLLAGVVVGSELHSIREYHFQSA